MGNCEVVFEENLVFVDFVDFVHFPVNLVQNRLFDFDVLFSLRVSFLEQAESFADPDFELYHMVFFQSIQESAAVDELGVLHGIPYYPENDVFPYRVYFFCGNIF